MATIPDQGNFDLGDHPIPDNFLDDTMEKAMTQHQRKESQMASVEDDFAKVLDQNVATNIAANLFAYIGDEPPSTKAHPPPDPDENDARQEDDDQDNNAEDQYTIDDMLVDAVTSHKHRESRTDFVTEKLHEMFPQEEEDDDLLLGDAETKGAVTDMSKIANNLISFLHDEPEENGTTQNVEKKARGSTDLSDLQHKIDALQSKVNSLESQTKTDYDEKAQLNNRIKQLEDLNHNLTKEIQHLQNSKTTLAMSATKCIDDLRSMLVQYQKHINLDQ